MEKKRITNKRKNEGLDSRTLLQLKKDITFSFFHDVPQKKLRLYSLILLSTDLFLVFCF